MIKGQFTNNLNCFLTHEWINKLILPLSEIHNKKKEHTADSYIDMDKY